MTTREFQLWLALGLVGCTPIHPVGAGVRHRDAGLNAADAAQSTSADASPSGDAATVPAQGGDCAGDGARSCAGHASQSPLLCKDSAWQPQPACADTERCDTAPGPSQGMCRPIALECMGQTPGVAFCESSVQRMCVDLVSSQVLPCGDQQHCVFINGKARCACVPGSVDDGTGCHEATDCGNDQGGCDLNTECQLLSGMRVCSGCPTGFSGTGDTGCAPLLSSLTAAHAEVFPALAPSLFNYRIDVPFVAQQVTITPVAPANTRVEIDGAPVNIGAGWTSAPLNPGANTAKLTIIALRSGLSSVYTLTIVRSTQQEAYLKAGNPGNADEFGVALGLDGDTLVVGALYEDSSIGGVNPPQSDNNATDSGAAYVFVRKAGIWMQQAYLKADSPVANDFFGAGVAISGDTIVVGALRDNPFNPLPNPTRSGIAYVFVRKGEVWTPQGQLKATDEAPGNSFGFAVAIQKDTVLIGSPEESTTASHSGAAYVYTRNGTTWTQQAKLKPNHPLRDSLFGGAVAIDDDTVVIGSQQDDSTVHHGGSARVYVGHDSTWVEQQRLEADTPVAEMTFGYSVALDGDHLAIGAPAANVLVPTQSGEVFIFDRAAGQWTQSAKLVPPVPRQSDFFGARLALLGSTLLVGANGEASSARGLQGDASRSDATNAGAAYLFLRQTDNWTRTAYIKASNAQAQDGFGYFVALSDSMAVVSAIYESSSATGVNGNMNDNSVSAAGAVYVFR